MTLDKALLCSLAEKFGCEISEGTFLKLDIYADMLVETNKQFNLTAITDSEGVSIKHFADCLSIFKFVDFPEGASVIDVGTGAGFPGVVLKIVRPDLKVSFLDGTEKKLKFISSVLNSVGLDGNIMHFRAEEAGKDLKYREKFDFATARAVANLSALAEYCLPFVKTGGEFISMKSAVADDEITAAKPSIKILGGKFEADNVFNLTDDMPRRILLIRKISQTPSKYPRASAKIAKSPIK